MTWCGPRPRPVRWRSAASSVVSLVQQISKAAAGASSDFGVSTGHRACAKFRRRRQTVTSRKCLAKSPGSIQKTPSSRSSDPWRLQAATTDAGRERHSGACRDQGPRHSPRAHGFRN